MTESVPAVCRSELSPLAYLDRSAEVWADRIAVVESERRWTYAEHYERIRRLVGVLDRDLQVGSADKVATLLPNEVTMLELHYAVPAVGAILVPMNTRLAPMEYAYILEHSGASVLVADEVHRAVVEEALASMGTAGPKVMWADWQRPSGSNYESALACASPGTLRRPTSEDDLLSINYTSGTTGRPRGVMTTHRGAYLQSLGIIAESRLDARSVYLWTLPMFHCNGWAYTWAVTAMGARHVCLPEVSAQSIWGAMECNGITHMCAAPTVAKMVIGADEAHRRPEPVHMFIGGSPPAPSLLEEARTLNVDVTHLYGLTETYGPIAVCAWNPEWDDRSAEEKARLLARQGVGNVVSERLRVVDENMNDVPSDGETMGEIVASGNNVMVGYYRDPEATAEAFRGGWFHSGDLGVMQPDGYVEMRDRLKDVIISGGENISTIEVEQALVAHPQISEAAVFGEPDPQWGEVPITMVTVAEGDVAIDESELREFLRHRLARFKVPKRIEVVEELPKTGTGKIQKFMLRQWAREEREAS